MHFDFHAVKSNSLMGRGLSESRFDLLLVVVKPDFIQVDCKEQPGVVSYPFKVADHTRGGSFVGILPGRNPKVWRGFVGALFGG